MMVKVDIGCGTKKREGFIGMDMIDHPSIGVMHDLRVFPWPFKDDSIDEIHMDQVIEHLPDTVRTMEEIHRILKKTGTAKICYPWYRAYGAFGDPTHIHYFNDRMIEYFIEERLGGRYRYTNRFFYLDFIKFNTYPFLRWMPNRVLRFISRHLALDVVHGIEITIRPQK